MPQPYTGTGSLVPTFVPTRTVVLAVKPACAFGTRHTRLPTGLSGPLAPPTFGRQPPQLNYPPGTVPEQDDCSEVRHPMRTERYFPPMALRDLEGSASRPPAHATQSITECHYPGIVKVRGLSSFCANEHLYRTRNFAELLVEYSGEVVTLFVQVGTYPTRNFATLGCCGYHRRLPGLNSISQF